jgi:hypothetical protein
MPIYFERNGALVVEAFRRRGFDYLEGVGEISEADFFRALTERKVLQKLAETHPSPCRKQEVLLWVYIASDISMRFHGVHPFHAFPLAPKSITERVCPSTLPKKEKPPRQNLPLRLAKPR